MIYVGIIVAICAAEFFVRRRVNKNFSTNENREVGRLPIRLRKYHNEGMANNILEKKPQLVKGIGIGVSARPRPLEDSYMPAFLVGLGLARSLAAVNEIPLWQISHQENHLEAGLWSAQGPDADRFLLLHASGGTTDLLLAEKQTDSTYALTQAGGSKDLHAGQFVDRVGVALGLQFPAGAALEQLAATAADCIELPVAVRQGDVSLSGPATAALRKIEAGADPAALAAGVQYAMAETFVRMIRNVAAQKEIFDVLLVGGVVSNAYIRRHMIEKLAKRRIRVWIPESRFSPDNAAGCAAYAFRQGESSYE